MRKEQIVAINDTHPQMLLKVKLVDRKNKLVTGVTTSTSENYLRRYVTMPIDAVHEITYDSVPVSNTILMRIWDGKQIVISHTATKMWKKLWEKYINKDLLYIRLYDCMGNYLVYILEDVVFRNTPYNEDRVYLTLGRRVL